MLSDTITRNYGASLALPAILLTYLKPFSFSWVGSIPVLGPPTPNISTETQCRWPASIKTNGDTS